MRLKLARASLIVSLLLPFYFMTAALGVKFGLWSWQTGLVTMIAQLGAPLLGLTLLLGLVATGATLFRKPRTGWRMALAGLLVPVLALAYVGQVQSRSARIPPIHDISTDIADPPVFSPAVMAAREAVGANPVSAMDAPMGSLPAYQGPDFAALAAKTLGQVGHEAYPAVRPLALSADPARVAAAAEAEAKAQGWTLATSNLAGGVIEATAETFWFGFKDDVAIRIRPGANGGSVVDVRSTSRVGLSDIGANAARIEAFLAGLKVRAEAS
jgi:fatty-acyl-CoA synthase